MISSAARRLAILLPVALPLFLVSCSSLPKGTYDCKAYRPTNPSAVEVKVSLANSMIYVVEGNKLLLATPTTIGTPENPTPVGHFKVFQRIPDKRSNTYGFHVSSDAIRPGTRDATPAGSHYVGYPMAYWVEFAPGYGFHSGCVWPMPRSHGCLRIHKNVAPKFFELAKEGTPVYIAQHQPEDETVGRKVSRPTDYADPDPPATILISDQAFARPSGALFEDAPAPLLP
jgi:hypothetical protein